jgi:hypothetical protein
VFRGRYSNRNGAYVADMLEIPASNWILGLAMHREGMPLRAETAVTAIANKTETTFILNGAWVSGE